MTSPDERDYCSYLKKCAEKDLPGNSFPLGIQAPIERQTTMKSNSSVQYKCFHSINFFPCQRPPRKKHFCYCGRRICNVQSLQMCLKVAEEWSRCCSITTSPRTPHTTINFGPHIPQSSWEVLSQSCCVLTLRSQEELIIPVGMFTVSWGSLTIYFQHPFIKVNQKKLTWLPVEPLMMGTGLDVPYLPNGCLQALCPCFILPLPPGLSSISSYISVCFPCCHVFLGALVWYSINLVYCYLLLLLLSLLLLLYSTATKTLASLGGIKEWTKREHFWGEESYWCNQIKAGIKFHNSKLLSKQAQRRQENNKSLQSTEVQVNHIFLNNELLEEMLPQSGWVELSPLPFSSAVKLPL